MTDPYEYNPRDEGRVAREDRIGGLVIVASWVLTVVLLGMAVVMLVRG